MESLDKSLDKPIKYLATTTGRDRINRFVQYFAKFLVWYGNFDKETIKKLNNLQSVASQTRKMMRIGRQVEFIRGFAKGLVMTDDFLKISTLLKNFGLFIWLVHDVLNWAHAAGIAKFENIKDISRRGNKFWLLGLLSSFAGTVYKLRWNAIKLEQEYKIKKQVAAEKIQDEEYEKNLKALNQERAALLYTGTQEALDILIPSSALDLIQIESGYVGLAGAITSVMGGYTQWKSIK